MSAMSKGKAITTVYDPHPRARRLLFTILSTLAFMSGPAAAACDAPRTATEASSDRIRNFVRHKGMDVLTFVGYSGAEYEDPEGMMRHADRILGKFHPARTLVNICATEAGIGKVYELAKKKGFETLGIVSALARDENVPLSPCVDTVFYVRDSTWGGRLPGTRKLSPTSAAIVANSKAVVGIGGGTVARDELLAARRAGKKVTFIPADMNHRLAREKARKQGRPDPADFRGEAHAALAGHR